MRIATGATIGIAPDQHHEVLLGTLQSHHALQRGVALGAILGVGRGTEQPSEVGTSEVEILAESPGTVRMVVGQHGDHWSRSVLQHSSWSLGAHLGDLGMLDDSTEDHGGLLEAHGLQLYLMFLTPPMHSEVDAQAFVHPERIPEHAPAQ